MCHFCYSKLTSFKYRLLSIESTVGREAKLPRVSWKTNPTKQSDGDVPVILERLGSTPLLPLLPGPLCSRVVVPNISL